MTDKSILIDSEIFPSSEPSDQDGSAGFSPDQNADLSGQPVPGGERKVVTPVPTTNPNTPQPPAARTDNPRSIVNGQGGPLYGHTVHGNTAPRQQTQAPQAAYPQSHSAKNPYSQTQAPQTTPPAPQPANNPYLQTQAPQTTPPVPQPQKAPLSNDDVIAHTASLWKYIPVPQDEPEPYKEYISGTVDYPSSRIIAARVRGKKHKHEGTNCDDWFSVANLEKITFVAVSDGAGSRVFSRIGAKESCKAAIHYLIDGFKKVLADNHALKNHMTLPLQDPRCIEACSIFAGLVQQSVIAAYEAVEAAYEARKDNPAYRKVLGRELEFKDFSGTLLIAVLIPVSKSTKEHLVITCQIGDGMIAILNSQSEFSGSVKLMGEPDSGDFSGQTDFLTSEKMKKIETLQSRTKISRTLVDTVMMMSDGVADDYFPNETQMHRLYFDLIVNGILDRGPHNLNMSKIPPEQVTLLKRVPDPMAHPWVNDQTVKVPIQYTSRILEATGLTLEDLWKDQTILAWARQEVVKAGASTDPSERLKTWLDNYVERGSFDDRTLVIVTM